MDFSATHLIMVALGLAVMLISLTLHEFCHALVGSWLGDDTAKRMGRLTLNPAAHIDPVGTLLIPLFGALSGLPVFGWAKPVPFNPYNVRYGKWGAVLIALAGPFSNFLFAAFGLVAIHVAAAFGMAGDNLLVIFLFLLVVVNVVLGVFNFIPVPPLDGSKLLDALLDAPRYRNFLLFLHTRGSFILFGLILMDFYTPFHILGSIFNFALGAAFTLGGVTPPL